MFTGLIEGMAEVAEIRRDPPGCKIVLRQKEAAATSPLGASIALNGCCLTVVKIDNDCLTFEAGPETLAKTNLGMLVPGNSVNYERSLKVGDLLGGHFVTGHVDGVGTLSERTDDAQWSTFVFTAPPAVLPYLAPKGSIAVDGVSLTVVDVIGDRFSVSLIPHTLAVTTLGRLQPGGKVNLEGDLLAKYVSRQLSFLPSSGHN